MVEALSKDSGDMTNAGDGTINLFQDGSIILVPTPSADPKGELGVFAAFMSGFDL